jgi:hypothetical protein
MPTGPVCAYCHAATSTGCALCSGCPTCCDQRYHCLQCGHTWPHCKCVVSDPRDSDNNPPPNWLPSSPTPPRKPN